MHFATKCSLPLSRNSSHTTTPSDNSQQNCLPPLLHDYCLYIQRMNFKNEQNYSYIFTNYNKLYFKNKYNNFLVYLKNVYVICKNCFYFI